KLMRRTTALELVNWANQNEKGRAAEVLFMEAMSSEESCYEDDDGNTSKVTINLCVTFSGKVVKKCHQLFTINDICDVVEIWHVEHAFKIQHILSQVFGDVSQVREEDWMDDESELEDAIEHALTEWAPITEDEDFIKLFFENLSMASSINDGSNAEVEDIPNAVFDILDNLSIN
ncbi:hypothetical protein AWC38_SpisGene23091, partial [Stylophora pistillata]